ncbi:DsbA family oxidoreductase [Actinophytocola sp.]|uniref:DsbA family oxidoreductase n=1 Tax=Actinophytocola sp. TaxID=1872138 RepID=UPI002D80B85C|nr:DsbA family protein [Actinophytocola sp.]HET9143824.1 DsbA family protein [Actinophytocola sp.]
MTTESLVNPEPGTVTVWSDIGCPWATLALHTLRAAIARRGADVLIDHRAFPLELFNSEPTPKFIVDSEIVVIGAKVPELGYRLWSGAESTYPVTMLPPMEAVQAAKLPEVGGLRASDELDAGLRRAFYTERRCVSIPAVILDVAGQCQHVDVAALDAAIRRGEGRSAVYDQWEAAKGDAVQGSPHLFAAGGFDGHNPGVTYQWTGSPYEGGFVDLSAHDPGWADDLLDSL